MIVKINYMLFKVPIEVVKRNNEVEVTFTFKKTLFNLKRQNREYDNEEFIYIMTEPNFYKKKPKLFLWDFKEEPIRQYYLKAIMDAIKDKEQKILKRKKLI